MNIKKIFCLGMSIVFMLGTTGCGEALYSMTPEEEEIITLYSAKTVTKFNKNVNKGVCNATLRPGELESASDTSQNKPAQSGDDVLENLDNLLNELSGNNTNNSNPSDSNTSNSNQNTSNVNQNTSNVNQNTSGGANQSTSTSGAHQSGLSLSEVLDVPGIEFTLSDFSVNETYSAGNYFVLNARNGYSYLAVNVKAKNKTSAPVSIDMLNSGMKFKLTVNNAYKQLSQTTILLNDLSTYKGTIEAGKSEDMVILFLFPTTQLGDIQSVGFEVEKDGNTRSTSF